MKRTLLISLSLLWLSASAQTVNWGSSAGSIKKDSIAKKILEPAKYVATYTYTYVRDADEPEDKRSGMTVLQVGERYNRFCDYYGLTYDALIDDIAYGKRELVETTPSIMSAMKKNLFKESIIIDKQTNKETIQCTVGHIHDYQYEEDCPPLNWEMLEGDTVISGYSCNKARTSLFGRDYIAWYSPEIDMPYGPYKFNGLPGLVLHVTDTQGHFEFLLDGLEKAEGYAPIYMRSKKNIVKTNRKTVRKIYRNYCADPGSALLTSGNVQISEEARAVIKPKPYNPIELE